MNRYARLFSLFLLLFGVTACAGQPSTTTGSSSTPLAGPSQGPTGLAQAPTAQMQAALVPSELVVGQDRFAVGLFGPSGQMIHDAAVRLQYYDLQNPNSPVLESEADAVRLQTPDGLTTIYAHERSFDRAGTFGAVIAAKRPDGTLSTVRIGFKVLAESPTLKVGQKVPSIDTPTAASVNDDLKRLTSATQPNPAFHRVSLAQALKSGKPTVLLLSTPAFCTSRMCGPAYDMTSALEKRYGDKLNFVSVEVYAGLPSPAADNFMLAPVMSTLGLKTEPWLFLVDKEGTVAYRVEGLFTTEQVDGHIQSLLKKGS